MTSCNFDGCLNQNVLGLLLPDLVDLTTYWCLRLGGKGGVL